uniref:Uncharacterized protein n=1 Tax=Romanomermis culicivorax TaxID=13658 RepID=A0A915JPD6_ROMCU
MGISFGCNKVNKSIPTTPKEAETSTVDKFYSNKENSGGGKSAKLIENSYNKDKATVDPIMADSNIEKQIHDGNLNHNESSYERPCELVTELLYLIHN